jgi:hypothetical protein
MYFYTLTEIIPQGIFRDFVAPVELLHNTAVDSISFGAYGGTVQRDFGAIDTNPFSSEFGPEFGPGARGDQNLAFSATIARDYNSPIEVPGSALRPVIVPIEFRSGAAVVLNSGNPIEWLSSSSASADNPMEWRSAIALDAQAPVFWLRQFNLDRTMPAEWGLSVSLTTPSLAEFGTTRRHDPSVNVEWRSTFLRDTVAPMEPVALAVWSPLSPVDWTATPLVDALAPAEWGLSARIDSAAPLELNMGPRTDYVVPVDWGQPAQTITSITVPLEFVSRIFEFRPADIDFGGGKFFPTVVPAEWTGNIGVTSDSFASLEWRGSMARDADVGAEWRSAFIVDAAVPTFWLSSFVVSPIVPTEFNISVRATIDAPLSFERLIQRDALDPVESLLTARRDIVVPEANSGSATGATGDANVPLSFSGGLASSFEVPVEFVGLLRTDITASLTWPVALIVDQVSPLSFPLTVNGDLPAPIDPLLELNVTRRSPVDWSTIGISATLQATIETLRVDYLDATVETNWSAPLISPDTAALIEWTQNTVVTYGDATAPLDFLSWAVVNVTVGLERMFGRGSIGSTLEPDEWEREHE